VTAAPVTLNGASVAADPEGALWWPARRLLAVADLHLEKGSSYARFGTLLPPYDSGTTLMRLERLLRRYRPETVVALGDSFHDADAPARLGQSDRARLTRLVASTDWVWIAGNHDPEPPPDMGGRRAAVLTIGPVTFRHEPAVGTAPGDAGAGEVAGHLHPRAAVALREATVAARCFVTDGRRLVLPAFGAYTGGLDVHHPEFRRLFRRGFRVFLMVRDRLHAFPAGRLLPPRDAPATD